MCQAGLRGARHALHHELGPGKRVRIRRVRVAARLHACGAEHGGKGQMEGQRSDGKMVQDPEIGVPEAGGVQHACRAQGDHREVCDVVQREAHPPVARLRHAGGVVQERYLRGCIGLQCCCPVSKGFRKYRAFPVSRVRPLHFMLKSACMPLGHVFPRSSGYINLSFIVCSSGPTGIAGLMLQVLSHLAFKPYWLSLSCPYANKLLDRCYAYLLCSASLDQSMQDFGSYSP